MWSRETILKGDNDNMVILDIAKILDINDTILYSEKLWRALSLVKQASECIIFLAILHKITKFSSGSRQVSMVSVETPFW